MTETPRDIVLAISAPPSVNRTRKVDWLGHKKLVAWRKQVNGEIAEAGAHRQWLSHGMSRSLQCFELHIAVADDAGPDIDNITKAVGDQLRRIEAIADDSRRHMRKLVVEVSPVIAPGTIRVTIKPIGSEPEAPPKRVHAPCIDDSMDGAL